MSSKLPLDDSHLQLILESNKKISESVDEVRKSLDYLRKTNHEINSELHGLNGQMQILRNELTNQKQDNKERFERVHARIDKEQEESKKVAETVNDIKPKVDRIVKVSDWILKGMALAVVSGIMYQTALFITK